MGLNKEYIDMIANLKNKPMLTKEEAKFLSDLDISKQILEAVENKMKIEIKETNESIKKNK